MKKYIVSFVLSNKGKYYHDDFVGLEIIAEAIKTLFLLRLTSFVAELKAHQNNTHS